MNKSYNIYFFKNRCVRIKENYRLFKYYEQMVCAQ